MIPWDHFRTLKSNAAPNFNVDHTSNALDKHREVARKMAALFDRPEEYFLEWPSEDAAEMLKRAEKHTMLGLLLAAGRNLHSIGGGRKFPRNVSRLQGIF